ncbi:transposase (plasmid) [Lichenicola cladoniae]|uniref:Transposase n=1 Tax=Lichenicola cladoniae TaxID=1484109 RepID=A0A6M8HXI1_9PROT|nr:transposase [Acetobacteraceae bacterium]QKE93233.1 transposase [Lichenicola cladoniae]
MPPPAFVLTGANTNDSMPFEELFDDPAISGKTGRARHRPDKLHADKAYDHRRCRQACRRRGIALRIAKRGIETSQKLGRHRWVIERTFAWINRNRRLVTCYERRSDIHHAFTALACALTCFNKRQPGGGWCQRHLPPGERHEPSWWHCPHGRRPSNQRRKRRLPQLGHSELVDLRRFSVPDRRRRQPVVDHHRDRSTDCRPYHTNGKA